MSVLSEARVLARQIVNDPLYRASLRERAIKGYLAPGLESLLWAYAYGKPPERVELGRIGEADLNTIDRLTDQELAERAHELAAALAEPEALAAPEATAEDERENEPVPATTEVPET